jgi:hypothetical protein
MKRARFTEEQIIGVLREHEGTHPTCAQGRGRRVRRRSALGYAATAVGALTATSMRAFQAQGINSSILVMGWLRIPTQSGRGLNEPAPSAQEERG